MRYTVFYSLGSNSIPYAIVLLKHDSPTVRRAAAMGLAQLQRQYIAANQAIPALIEALSDMDKRVGILAAITLAHMGPDASNAVPALASIVANTGVGRQTSANPDLRAAAAKALGKIGPAAAGALPTLKSVLQESHSYLRGSSAVAIWRINCGRQCGIAGLSSGNPEGGRGCQMGLDRCSWRDGVARQAGGPQLTTELEQHHEKWFLDYITNALKSIEPGSRSRRARQMRPNKTACPNQSRQPRWEAALLNSGRHRPGVAALSVECESNHARPGTEFDYAVTSK